MKLFQMRDARGFTLIEMVVVVGIIGVLSSVVMFSVSQARENARDKTRLVDIEQLHLLFKLYQEGFNAYPADVAYDNGVEIGVGGAIDTVLNALQPHIPKDPKSSSAYQYVYDTDFECTAAGETVLYVKAFESITSNANASSLCTSAGTSATGDEYIIILE